tara:strand:- start:674 stop:847 length:174 start_codon:yes stop_codon:yes gene_type:complete
MIRVICNTDGNHFLVHWPSGRVEFIGFWALMKLCWWSVVNKHDVVLVDAKTGTETRT